MARHLNPLEKEFLIKQYKSNLTARLNDFCDKVGVSNTAFKKWLKQYEEGDIEGLARADAEIKKGELERKNTFENRVLSEEPKFVQKRRKQAHSADVSTFEKIKRSKMWCVSTFEK